MKTTMKKSVAKVITMALVLMMMLSLAVPAMAADLPAAKGLDEVKHGVFKFNMEFDMSDKGLLLTGRGTAFLINDEYIVTAAHCVRFTEAEANYWGYTLNENLAAKYQVVKNEPKYSVTVERDMTVGATLVNMSESMDFAIMKLDQKIPTRKYLTLRDSKEVKAAEQVYTVGFPAFYDRQNYDSDYTVDDVTVKTGVISKIQGLDSFSYTSGQECKLDVLTTTCNLGGGDSGGPLVDVNGYVVGVSIAGDTKSVSDNYYSASAIDQVMRACDNLGIEYHTSKEAAPVVETQPAATEAPAPAATEAPAPAATEAPVVETQPPHVHAYTEGKCQCGEVCTHPSVANNVCSTCGVKVGGGIDMTVILIVAAVAVVAVIVVIIVVMNKGKKKQQQPAYSAPTGGFAPAAPTYTAPMGAGETTILGGDAGATTVLSRGGSLIRKRTNETIVINAERFIIGRERKTANYCVADNSSVSRSHVTLITRGGVVYLMDMNAANGTFVNGVKVMANQEIALKNGDKIKLADEEFEFRA